MMFEPLSPLANHLWQSTAFAGAAFALTLTLRQNRARLRYWIWLVASLKFLVPFSLFLWAGSQVEWTAAQEAAIPVSAAIGQISQPFTPATAVGIAHSVQRSDWNWVPALALGIWLLGISAITRRWWIRWRGVRVVLSAAQRLPVSGPVPVMSAPSRLEPGIFGVWRPVLLLPEGIERRLTPAQFRAILAHEFCHVQRRDNVTSALHMLVEAIFWFHPLVWWIGSRLIDERERACDEEVLGLGNEAEAYASGILNVCRLYLETPLACAPGVTGSDLRRRVEAIMARPILRGLTFARKLLLAGAALAAIGIPAAIGVLTAPRIRAQAQGAPPLRFEVATIKLVTDSGGRGSFEVLPGGELRMGGATVRQLISFAYDVREEQISGGPRWVGADVYQVRAKPEKADSEAGNRSAPGTKSWDRLRQRMQTLLAERMRLAIHKDSKEGPAYDLVQVKGGTKLQPSDDDRPPGTTRSRGAINGRNGSMKMLATVLSNWLGRPVVDRTGLTDLYTYKLEYAQETGEGPGAPPETGNGFAPSLFSALQEQLGLKLEPGRAAIETIVIDRVERPSAN